MPVEVMNSLGERSRFDENRLKSALIIGGLDPMAAEVRAGILAMIIKSLGYSPVRTDGIRYGIGELAINPRSPEVERIADNIRRFSGLPDRASERIGLTDMSMGRAFMAGLLGGISRYLNNSVAPSEFFGNFVADMVRDSAVPDQMRRLLTSIGNYYQDLQPAEKRLITGLYFDADIQSPVSPRAWTDNLSKILMQPWSDRILRNELNADPVDLCCKAVSARFSAIKVVTSTSGPGDDDVAMTAVSSGRSDPAPTAYRFPEKETKEGEEWTPNELVCRVVPSAGRTCPIILNTTYDFIEVDSNKIDELLRQAIAELSLKGLTAAPVDATALVQSLLNEILDKLGLKDDLMDQFTVVAAGSLYKKHVTIGQDVKFITPDGMDVTIVNNHEALLSKTIRRKGGEWKIKLRYFIED